MNKEKYLFPNTIEEIDKFSGDQFEEFLFYYYKIQNYKPIRMGKPGDRGIDLLIEEGTKRIGIQAKRWKSEVGYNEIMAMLAGKEDYKLDEVGIITTSKLTRQADIEAKNHDIDIYTRKYVIEILNDLKNNPEAKFREESNEILKKEIAVTKTDEIISEQKEDTLINQLKTLRNNLSKEFHLFPVYMVFGNETLEELDKYIPITFKELSGIKGLGEKKINTFGQQIIDLIINYVKETWEDEITKLFLIREKITKYNNLNKIEDAFNDIVLINLAIMKPETLEELANIDDFPKDNISLFGDYLIKQLTNL